MTDGPAPVPAFRLGVAFGGFEEEGGYNGPRQPANNWSWWEAEGRAPPSPPLNQAWPRWSHQLAAAAGAGCRAARVSVEWARCEPLDGTLDRRAFGDYCRLLDSCHDIGLQPVVTLHRVAHPAWLGVDFWLRPDSPERFRRWVAVAVDRLAGRTHRWVTIDQLNISALWSYFAGHRPPGRRLDTAATVRCLDHLLAAHVLAAEAIKEHQPQAVVGLGTRALPVYELDRLLVDLLLGRSHGVDRHDLGTWLAERRHEFDAVTGAARTALAWVVRQWAASAVPLERALARATAAVYESACERSIDVLHLGTDDADLRRLLPFSIAGQAREHCSRVTDTCLSARGLGLAVSIVSDSPTDERRFHCNVTSVEQAVRDGAPVVAYYHRATAEGFGRCPPDAPVADRRAASMPLPS